MSSGAITLGDLRGHVAILYVACRKCERRGRYALAGLLDRHGADAKLPDLRAVYAGDCSRVKSVAIYDGCGVHYPRLPVRV